MVSSLSRYSGAKFKYQKAIKNSIDLTQLGWAIHYLQDMTAPHHAGNMALYFENFTDGTNSHFQFEKYAREYVYAHNQDFRDSAQIHYNDLSQNFDPNKPQLLSKIVFAKAVENIPLVKGNNISEWDKAIQNAIPLAIGATAVVLQVLKQQ